MRTTVDIPTEVIRKAKAIAAERGESLKALLTRAVLSEIGKSTNRSNSARHVRLPLFGSPGKPIDVTNEDIARAVAADDGQNIHRLRPTQKKK